MKDFNDLHATNSKLRDRGYMFSSTFLGGKSIAWSFDSELEKDGFIRNSFFWRDNFSSMSKWRDTPTSSDRLRWVEVFGVPLHCWCKAFFSMVGDHMGETIWVDEVTEAR